jgi:ribose-phosphate pyrophosphokinase
MKKEDLRLIVLDNMEDFGSKTNEYLKEIRKTNEDYIIPITRDRFSNGEGKIKIGGTVRDKDIYIISDVGNYDVTYNMHGFTHHMSPDEHFQDIKRVISAISGYASKITLVMPLLYESRQHKRKGKESLDCAIALKELEALGVNHIVTFDAHDPNVANAIPNLPFENFYPTHDILTDLVTNEDINNLLVVSPDMGAMERARYYAEMLGSDVGVFYKRRDLSKVDFISTFFF